MMRWPLVAVLTGLLVLVAASEGGCRSHPGADAAGIDDFGVVTDGARALYRGAQPSEQGISTLRSLGVRTIVNLRDDADPREQEWAAAAGMQYVRIPSTCADPRADDLRRFLRMMEGGPVASQGGAPVAFPVFVHCKVGRDRTGLFVATYRIVEQHWSNDRALREMDDYGHSAIDCPMLDPFVKQLDPAAYGDGGAE
jgi:protein tyrosine/serine phosphatase